MRKRDNVRIVKEFVAGQMPLRKLGYMKKKYVIGADHGLQDQG
ncbi:MAG: hypothetical protein ACP5JF_06490 [Candidatus Methanodesulfokora sp.]|jgi:hypothetical protein